MLRLEVAQDPAASERPFGLVASRAPRLAHDPRGWRTSSLLGALALAGAGSLALAGSVAVRLVWAPRAPTPSAASQDVDAPSARGVAAAEAVGMEAQAPPEPPGVAPIGASDPSVLGPPGAGERRGAVDVPTGAAEAVTWAAAGGEVRWAVASPVAKPRRSYVMDDPPRLVFDLEGALPERSYSLPTDAPFGLRVRIGAQPRATRVVVDLARAPVDATEDGDAVVLTF